MKAKTSHSVTRCTMLCVHRRASSLASNNLCRSSALWCGSWEENPPQATLVAGRGVALGPGIKLVPSCGP